MIVVVGSANHDLITHVDHHPAPGETVLGLGHETMPGGKGANQAVAAARLGSDIVFVGRVGADEVGHALSAGLASEGIDTSHLAVDQDVATGLAIITVDDAGENSIVVSPGANGRVSSVDVDGAAAVLMAATVNSRSHSTPYRQQLRHRLASSSSTRPRLQPSRILSFGRPMCSSSIGASCKHSPVPMIRRRLARCPSPSRW